MEYLFLGIYVILIRIPNLENQSPPDASSAFIHLSAYFYS
jgi:hypothetical protein